MTKAMGIQFLGGLAASYQQAARRPANLPAFLLAGWLGAEGQVYAVDGQQTILRQHLYGAGSESDRQITECVAGSTGQRSFFFLSTTLLPKVERQQRQHNKKDQSDAKPGGA